MRVQHLNESKMTDEEKLVKRYILKQFKYYGNEADKLFAKLFEPLDFHLTKNPRTVGFMRPDDHNAITINRTLQEDQYKVVVKHEILHGYLRHELRMLKHLAEKYGLDYDVLTGIKVKDLGTKKMVDTIGDAIDDAIEEHPENEKTLQDLKDELYSNKDFNKAGDYEISNEWYSDDEKEIERHIILCGREVKCLVTEDQHPDWVNLTMEQMYDKLQELRRQDNTPKKQKIISGILISDNEFMSLSGKLYSNTKQKRG